MPSNFSTSSLVVLTMRTSRRQYYQSSHRKQAAPSRSSKSLPPSMPEVDHAKATYGNNKAFYSELPEFLPTDAQILACRMANASNALPEQCTGALIHLNTSLEKKSSHLPSAPRRERNWRRNARSVKGGRDLLDESGWKPAPT
ncbi:hypothetical protein B0T13DRAFT_486854 [Neurospora crassa]|nr:hypothetical protein B0T13DRAFT_486854 [Neurospora crassa]